MPAPHPSTPTASRPAPKVGFVSLGCPKALVDSERILTQMRAEGYETSATYDAADVVVVNTCGFIDAAIQESLDTIGEALAENGKVIVTGCLGKKSALIREKYPDVLSISGPQDYAAVMNALHEAVPPQHDPFLDLLPPQGVKLTPRHYAYLKISEGCNNKCSFCIIPSLRGTLHSRRIDEVLGEAEKLVKAGVKELLVISQDTSAYGADLRYAKGTWRGRERETRLYALCEALGELGAWVRLHYVYPYPHVDGIIPLMAQGKILPYLDIPFQHASPKILKAMRRPAAAEDTLRRLAAWRAVCPALTVRSTFIVGFPGETEDDFRQLLDWLEQAQIDRAGCFPYSPVDGAAANGIAAPVPEAVKQERYTRFMETQARISAAKLRAKVGTRIAVLVDAEMDGILTGRSWADAPEIDGKVYLSCDRVVRIGEIVTARVVDANDYDLNAEVLDD